MVIKQRKRPASGNWQPTATNLAPAFGYRTIEIPVDASSDEATARYFRVERTPAPAD